MKSFFFALGLTVALGASPPPEPSIAYFTNVRDLRISQPGAQNYFSLDEEIWTRARLDLADLRIYDGESQVQYAFREERGGTSSQEVNAKILNLGSVDGRAEFDLDLSDASTGQIGEYDRIRLSVDAEDFVVTASVAGSNELNTKSATQLPPATLYDFSREDLGSNSVLKLPPSTFRYLHIKLSAGIAPAQIKGASGLQPAGNESRLDERGVMQRVISNRAHDRRYLQCSAAHSGGSRPLPGGSEASKFPASGCHLGRKRPSLQSKRRDYAGADESRRHHGGLGGNGRARRARFRPSEDHCGQRGQSTPGYRGRAAGVC
jgi:hypothetical protein